MNIYTISDDVYFNKGIISLAAIRGWHVISQQFDQLLQQDLTFEDVVILHLDAKNGAYAKAISHLNKLSKLLIILDTSRNILINDADDVIKSRDSLSAIGRAMNRIIKKQKKTKIKANILSEIENIILKESLQGKSIRLIANTLNITPKKVYAHRNNACKKLGGKKIRDLHLIREKLLEEVTILPSPMHNINTFGWSL
ncbi:helix-turn-helix transcriptional regulator [Salmonella enterica]